ncbi:hypothetical protein WJX73_002992 [Symbiochloris irregularis]|uniref:Uncharacterized protein n=1 Tax=Symbiochloris irregularis TaxID=706552 RepID=A0AAW1PJQ3_9CHLO
MTEAFAAAFARRSPLSVGRPLGQLFPAGHTLNTVGQISLLAQTVNDGRKPVEAADEHEARQRGLSFARYLAARSTDTPAGAAVASFLPAMIYGLPADGGPQLLQAALRGALAAGLRLDKAELASEDDIPSQARNLKAHLLGVLESQVTPSNKEEAEEVAMALMELRNDHPSSAVLMMLSSELKLQLYVVRQDSDGSRLLLDCYGGIAGDESIGAVWLYQDNSRGPGANWLRLYAWYPATLIR